MEGISMANIQFTPEQQHAIDVRQGNILISAAAGSGKTAVLTQHVIELLTGQPSVPADQLVIVTFTIAAAAEMKQRIEQTLNDLLEESPESQLLQSQQLMLSKAKISTIHSLCNELIKDHFELLNLPVNYRLAEENELQILKNEVLEEVLETCYLEKQPEFLKLADCLCEKDDKKLLDMTLYIYQYIRSYPFPLTWLDKFSNAYHQTDSFLSTIWGQTLSHQIEQILLQAKYCLMEALHLMQTDELVNKQYAPAFENDLNTVQLLFGAFQSQQWNHMISILRSYQKQRIGAVRGYEDKEFLEQLKDLRKTATDLLSQLEQRCLITNEQEYQQDLTDLNQLITPLFSFVRQFYLRLEQVKLERGMIDFADLEHFTLNLLIRVDGEYYQKSPVAVSLSEQYYEIMIDECQDINQVQNLIFWAISKGSEKISIRSQEILTDSQNLFLVGDVKQSIYRFRNAMPTLFVQRKKLFKPYQSDFYDPHSCYKILLQDNFRSRKEVTQTVNTIFSNLMTEQLGDILYNHEEALKPSASYLPFEKASAEFHLLSLSDIADEAPSDKRYHKTDIEAEYIASLIEKMVAEGYLVQEGNQLRPCRYQDFCILLRAKKTKTDRYLKKLKEKQINCYADASSGYFDSFEIAVMLDLLRIIDNPLLDISLFSVLVSPMFGFTPDDVTQIRLKDRKRPLYINLQQMAQEGHLGCLSFLTLLNRLREQALLLTTDRLIQRIYDQTGFLFVVQAMSSGEQKRANLRLLLSYAENYEKIGYHGLDGFIRFIDKAIERNEDFQCANTISEQADVVKIMSIHGSKGLEFPICIIADLGKPFNLMDLNKSYLINSEVGFGMTIRKPEELKEYTNLPLEAIRLASKRETLSEEMRTLYVALTRAKEKLILVGSLNNIEKTIEKTVKFNAFSSNISPFWLLQQRSYCHWLIASLCKTESFYQTFADCYPEKPVQLQQVPLLCHIISCGTDMQTEQSEPVFTAQPDPQILQQLETAISFTYDYQELSELPAKITVTNLAKAKQGEQLSELEPLSLPEQSNFTGAQRGTILHHFMQYADFSTAQEDLESEIQNLVTKHYLTVKEAKALNRKKIKAFLQSDLFERIKKAKTLHREYQFIYEMNAKEVEETISEKFSNEKILMQGIADVIIEEANQMILVDYKTDRFNQEQEFIDRYFNQLRIYKEALSQYFEKPIQECYIYSLYLEKSICIPDEML